MACVMAVGLLVFGFTAVSISALNSNSNSEKPSHTSREIVEFTSGYHAIELTALPKVPTN